MSSSSHMSSSSFNRSVELVDASSSTTNATNATFTPLHRTAEVENLHDHVDQDKQSTNKTTTKKVLTKCITVIGDGTDK